MHAATNPEHLRVLIVDRHDVARSALRAQLIGDNSIETIGEASNAKTGAETAAHLQPELILLDNSSPEAIRSLHSAAPKAKILVLGLETDTIYANRALDAGAAAYVARETVDGSLPELIHRIADGEHSLLCLP